MLGRAYTPGGISVGNPHDEIPPTWSLVEHTEWALASSRPRGTTWAHGSSQNIYSEELVVVTVVVTTTGLWVSMPWPGGGPVCIGEEPSS